MRRTRVAIAVAALLGMTSVQAQTFTPPPAPGGGGGGQSTNTAPTLADASPLAASLAPGQSVIVPLPSPAARGDDAQGDALGWTFAAAPGQRRLEVDGGRATILGTSLSFFAAEGFTGDVSVSLALTETDTDEALVSQGVVPVVITVAAQVPAAPTPEPEAPEPEVPEPEAPEPEPELPETETPEPEAPEPEAPEPEPELPETETPEPEAPEPEAPEPEAPEPQAPELEAPSAPDAAPELEAPEPPDAPEAVPEPEPEAMPEPPEEPAAPEPDPGSDDASRPGDAPEPDDASGPDDVSEPVDAPETEDVPEPDAAPEPAAPAMDEDALAPPPAPGQDAEPEGDDPGEADEGAAGGGEPVVTVDPPESQDADGDEPAESSDPGEEPAATPTAEDAVTDGNGTPVPVGGLRLVAASGRAIAIAWDGGPGTVTTVERDGVAVATVEGGRYIDTDVVAGQRYTYTLGADPDRGRVFAEAVTDELGHDVRSPQAPGEVIALRRDDGAVVVAWHGGGDDRGVAGYDLYRDGRYFETVYATAHVDAGAPDAVGTLYEVVAFDEARNYSPRSVATFVDGPLPGMDGDAGTVAVTTDALGRFSFAPVNRSPSVIVLIADDAATALWPTALDGGATAGGFVTSDADVELLVLPAFGSGTATGLRLGLEGDGTSSTLVFDPAAGTTDE